MVCPLGWADMDATSPLGPDRVVQLARSIDDDLGRRIEFILELDRLKSIIRRSRLVDRSRFENTAEHSWHLAMLALVLAPYAGDDVDVTRAMQLVLVHDIVEIDADDTYIYDEQARADKAEKELAAAERIFGLLPPTQGAELRALWDAYESRSTATGRFAYALDRLQPLLLNAAAGGISWLENGIRRDQVEAVNRPIAEGSSVLWDLARSIIDEATATGVLASS